MKTKQEIAPKTKSSVRELDIPDIVFYAILEERKDMRRIGAEGSMAYGHSRIKDIFAALAMAGPDVKIIIISIIKSYWIIWGCRTFVSMISGIHILHY